MTDLQPPTRELSPMAELSATSDVREADPFNIPVEGRLRPVDQARVNELAESIRATAQLQPVLCTYKDQKLYLVAGAHRVMACRQLNRPVLYTTFSKTLINEEDREPFLQVMELDENLFRSDLSPEDRKKMMAIRGKNMDAIAELNTKINGGNSGTGRTGNSGTGRTGKAKRKTAAQWFIDWHGDGKIMPKQTAVDWWDQYRNSIGQKDLTPSKASKIHQAAFFEFLAGQEEEAKKKASEAVQAQLKADRDKVFAQLYEWMTVENTALAVEHWIAQQNTQSR